ncbi:hypothetical protein ACLB2K_009095 [Fragaria x ananassa]
MSTHLNNLEPLVVSPRIRRCSTVITKEEVREVREVQEAALNMVKVTKGLREEGMEDQEEEDKGDQEEEDKEDQEVEDKEDQEEEDKEDQEEEEEEEEDMVVTDHGSRLRILLVVY